MILFCNNNNNNKIGIRTAYIILCVFTSVSESLAQHIISSLFVLFLFARNFLLF